MKHRFICILVCILTTVISVTIKTRVLSQPTTVYQTPTTEITEEKIQTIAKKITVRVLPAKSPEDGASGTLIEKTEQKHGKESVYLYLVLTNDHVLKILKERATRLGGVYQVETYDNQLHQAWLYTKINFKNNDLGLLWFTSRKNYQIAKKAKSKDLNEYEKVFVSGFPSEIKPGEKVFEFTSGRVNTFFISSNKPLDAGYRLGFTNDTKNGMSGGPILNKIGALIGINGRGKNQIQIFYGDPKFGNSNPYAYVDGTEPPKEIQGFMRHFAWGIPIETYTQFVPNNPFDKLYPQSALKDNSITTTYSPIDSARQQEIYQEQKLKHPSNHLILNNIIYVSLLLIAAPIIIFYREHISSFIKNIFHKFRVNQDNKTVETNIRSSDTENFSNSTSISPEEPKVVNFGNDKLIVKIIFDENEIYEFLLNQQNINYIDDDKPQEISLDIRNFTFKGRYKIGLIKLEDKKD